MPSFRVRGKIFATVPDDEHIRIFVDAPSVRAAVAKNPVTVEEVWWAKRLRGVSLDLRLATEDLMSGLLTEAWRRKAPSVLLRELEDST